MISYVDEIKVSENNQQKIKHFNFHKKKGKTAAARQRNARNNRSEEQKKDSNKADCERMQKISLFNLQNLTAKGSLVKKVVITPVKCYLRVINKVFRLTLAVKVPRCEEKRLDLNVIH